jgi:hypothetical protein
VPTAAHIKGLILEEVILFLLRVAGYRTIEVAGTDPTLGTCAAGLQVRGRGGEHQIDAIADFAIGQPFSYPQRLLVEAKCYDAHPVRLPLVRNAVGVLKDVSEFWASPRSSLPQKNRYHYHFALFSTSAFTKEAQRYAFAHDIHLLPLAGSSFFAPIVREIKATVRRIEQVPYKLTDRPLMRPAGRLPLNASELRGAVRAALQPSRLYPRTPEHQRYEEALRPLVEACHRLGGAIIAMISNNFPLFLVPAPDLNLEQLHEVESVQITWDQHGWCLVSSDTGRVLFSFDLPAELFALYAEAGTLDPLRALDLKEDFLAEIQAVMVSDGRVRLLHFRLDREWLEEVRARVIRTYQPSEASVREPW